MNDFTKEELEGIKNIIIRVREDYPLMHSDRELTELVTKIKSLIDNYYEHEYRHSNEANFKCINCGVREK